MAEGGSWGDKRVGAHVVIDPCSLSHPYLGQDQSCSPCHLLIGENYTWLPSQLLLHSHEKWPSSHGDFGGKRVAGTPATPLPPSSSPLWRFPLSMASYVVSVILGRFRGSPLAIGNRAEYIITLGTVSLSSSTRWTHGVYCRKSTPEENHNQQRYEE